MGAKVMKITKTKRRKTLVLHDTHKYIYANIFLKV